MSEFVGQYALRKPRLVSVSHHSNATCTHICHDTCWLVVSLQANVLVRVTYSFRGLNQQVRLLIKQNVIPHFTGML